MDEQQTTTDATTQETGAEVTAQPEEQHAEAVTTTESEPQQTDNAPTAEETAQADFNDWLAKKGIDPSDPEALAKVAEMARNSEKLMHETTKSASELKKQLEQAPGAQPDTDNELVQQLFGEVTSIRREQAVNNFKAEIGLTDEQEQKMVSYLSEHPGKAELVNAGYLSLPELYNLSVGASIDKEGLKKQGGQQALLQLANKQRATAIPGNATTNALAPEKEDAFLAGLMKG